ncbi:FadR/GntR family transcriptional regulator [Pseudomonas oryzihabitans]|uniref:GntR family transcriptional regulator n=1 Tax=Pseudomonas oryzihabitans TaxID=47885 RepID=A0ABX3IRP3_9PSED|nr:FadR/GntR family transcriptional regulator [Pseudomonas psychrotolerans]ONN71037.1 GntR family transcriptional regulator [Pseudomonas psychrotolerans]
MAFTRDALEQTRPRRAEELTAQLAELIRSGHYRRGDKLPTELDIVQEYHFSRTVVREALLRLQAAGLVETRRSVGTFVVDLPAPPTLQAGPDTVASREDVLHLLEVRIGLEVAAAGLAAQRRTAEELADIKAALLQLKEQTSPQSGVAIQADFQFHLKIAKASGNTYLLDIMKHLGTKLIPRTRLASAYGRHADRNAYLTLLHSEHERIYEAIAWQIPESAQAAMFLHLQASQRRLLAAARESSVKD